MLSRDNNSLNNLACKSADILAKLMKASLISSCFFLSAAGYAHSQIQRSFINLSFEEPSLPSNNCWSIRVSEEFGGPVPGWRTTEGPPNGWASTAYGTCGGHPSSPPPQGSLQLFKGYQGVAAAEGLQWAELNAFTASRLYQSVCLLEGDKVDWFLHHKARWSTGDEIFRFNIGTDPSGTGSQTIIEAKTTIGGVGTITPGSCMGDCNVEPTVNSWAKYSGSFIWTQPSGEQTIGFQSVVGGTSGNYLDHISLFGLVPFVEFDRTSAEGLEGQHNASNFPGQILVSGNIPAGETMEVIIRIVDVDTTADDYSPANEIIVSIPEGDYAATPFHIPLDILSDGELEPVEKFQLVLEDKPGVGGYRVANTRTCGDPAINDILTYTIFDTEVTFLKEGTFVDLVGGLDADGQPIKNAGDRMDYTFTLTNNGGTSFENITVSDTIIGTPVLDTEQSDIDPGGRLAPGGKAVYRASYTITQADIDRGEISNVATLTATNADFPNEPPLITTSEHQELLPRIPAISMVKTGSFDPDTDNGNGLPDPGERIRFDITVTNDGNVSALNVQPDDPGPTFDGNRGTGTMSPFQPGPMTILPGQVQVFTAYYTLTAEDITVGSGITDAVANKASVSADSPTGETLDVEMPEPMQMTMPGFGVEKRAGITQAQRGGKVPYTLILKPLELVQTTSVRLADLMPAGFVYIPGTATVDGVAREPLIEGRRLSWEIAVEPEKNTEVSLVLGVSPTISHGTFTNIAQAERLDSDIVYSHTGQADVEIIPEPVFDCGDIIGKVFNDRNRNGYQDDGETGLPGARVTSIGGMLITTDEHGRFSVACADLPEARVGSSYIMKLDPRSLPSGYRIISENPRVIRLTAGKTSQLNFATSLTRVVRLDINGMAFLTGSTELSPTWQENIASLLTVLEAEPSVLRIVYHDISGDRQLANQRLKQIRNMVAMQWKESANRYRLEIEASLITGNAIAEAGK